MLLQFGGCGRHWDVSSPAMLQVPTPLQRGPDILEVGGHTHHCCGKAVLLFWEFLQADPSKEALCRAISAPATMNVHPPSCPTRGPALPHLWLLQLPLLPGQRAGAEAPHQHPSWALPACSTWEELAFGAQPSPGVNCPHLMQKIGSTLGISLVPSYRS